jgi:hypothetical protein
MIKRHTAAAATCLRYLPSENTSQEKIQKTPVIEIRENEERKEPTVVGREHGHLL